MQSEEEIIEVYKKKVLFLSRQYFLLGGDGDDLFQEGMIGLLSAIREYDESKGTSFSTFADRCIRRRMIDAFKSQKYSAYLTTDDDFYNKLDNCDPEDELIEKEKYNELLEKYRKIMSWYEFNVLKKYLDGYNYSEIAKMFDKSSTSVYNAIQRARNKISGLN